MSFFKRMFGGASFDEERDEGDRLFDAEEYEQARIAYQRAVDHKKPGPESMIAHCETRMHACLDQMAEARIAEAEELVEGGQLDLAEEELQHAIELARDESIIKRAKRRIETLEQEDAKIQAELPDEMSDEDRWAILAGTWDDDQLAEYDEYGDGFREAMLLLHDEKLEAGLEGLEELLNDAEEPVYLWLEVGRARAVNEDFEGAEEAIREFLDLLEEDEGGEAKLSGIATLARLREQAGDEEGAMEELSDAMEAFPDDPRPFLLMGQYLRGKGHGEEAAEVLEAGRALLDEDGFDWRYYQEVGLAHKDAGHAEAAADYLDRVIAFCIERSRQNGTVVYYPETAVARAELYEDEGRLEKAADLFRTLASGPDRVNHLVYHREAGRLLAELGLDDEARRMLTRAVALAEDDEDAREAIEAQLEELE
ncbi:MAG: tetratricopeptide repeat protein [Sandaracinaceae bacterium]